MQRYTSEDTQGLLTTKVALFLKHKELLLEHTKLKDKEQVTGNSIVIIIN